MSLFGKNWAGEILLETKRIFGIDHDASEQEVHEHLRSVESYEAVVAAAKTAGAEEVTALQSGLAETERQKDALENRVKDFETQVATLQANVDKLEKDAKALQTDLDAKMAEIAALKDEPATKHTGGETEPDNKGERAYEKNPIYQKAKAMRAKAQKPA